MRAVTPRRFRATVAVAMVAVMAASCSATAKIGGDIPPTTAAKVYPRTEAGSIESITDHLSRVGPNLNEWAAPADQARCAAEKIVAKLGVARLFQIGFDPQVGSLALAYSPDEQTAVLNLMTGCIDFAQGFLELWTSYGKLDITRTRCLTRTLDDDGLTRDLASGLLTGTEADPLTNDGRLGAGMARAMSECLDDTKDLVPVPAEDPFPQDKEALDTPTTVPAPSTTVG